MIKRQFYTELEGLRGVAVLLVLVSHFVIVPHLTQFDFLKLGFWGVNIFYVLSGFLITELLLIDIDNGKPTGQLLKGFYYRRVLRIFPIYYLTILFVYVFDIGNTRDVIWYAITYTYNLANVWNGTFSFPIDHFWSLCVEEQFYMFWPLLLIVVKKRYHLALIASLIAVGVVGRFIYYGLELPSYEYYIWSTPACFDCLGAGALLAWMKLYNLETLKKWLKLYVIPVGLIIMFFGFTLYGRGGEDSFFFHTSARFVTATVGFFLIGIGALTVSKNYGKVMSSSFLRFSGKISYGLYVYHMIIFVLFHEVVLNWVRTGINADWFLIGKLRYNAYIVSFIVLMAVSLLVAYLSFKLIEKPLSRLKGRVK